MILEGHLTKAINWWYYRESEALRPSNA